MNGSFDHDPQRRTARANEPKIETPVGNPPTCLTTKERRVWRDISSTVPWLTVADRYVLILACKLSIKVMDGTAKPQEYSTYMTTLSRLGMTPADKSRVSMPTSKQQADGWDDFAVTPAHSDARKAQ